MIDFGEFLLPSLESSSVVTSIQYVCYLFEGNKLVLKVNELRNKVFIKRNLSVDHLPPTLDALVLHLHRVNYQTFIWISACVVVLNLPTVLENDRVIESVRRINAELISFRRYY